MLFRRLRRLFEKRRYRDAAYFRPDLASRTEASWYERVLRSIRRRETFGYDEREARAGDVDLFEGPAVAAAGRPQQAAGHPAFDVNGRQPAMLAKQVVEARHVNCSISLRGS